MKVFISWSQERSKQVAGLLRVWLKCVLQNSEPWASTEDIESGSWWFTEIGNQLADTSIGIICLTKQNKNNPWILFEAGALTKGLSTSRVIPLFIDLEATDLVPPLSQLNGVKPTKQGIKSLVRTINSSLQENALAPDILDKVFDTYWSQFDSGFVEILATTEDAPQVEARGTDDILREVLSTVRGFDKRIRDIEQGGRQTRKIGTIQVPLPDIDPEIIHKLIFESIERFKAYTPTISIGVAVYDIVTNFGLQQNLPKETTEALIRLISDEIKRHNPNLI